MHAEHATRFNERSISGSIQACAFVLNVCQVMSITTLLVAIFDALWFCILTSQSDFT